METGATKNHNLGCRLGLAAVSLSILFAAVLMAAESLSGRESEGKQAYGSLVVSGLMGLFLVYDAIRTVEYVDSFTSSLPPRNQELVRSWLVLVLASSLGYILYYMIVYSIL